MLTTTHIHGEAEVVLPLNLMPRKSDLETHEFQAQRKRRESSYVSTPREVSQIPNMDLAMRSL